LDFLNQLEWCEKIMEQACEGTRLNNPAARALLTNSLLSSYIMRYGPSMQGIAGASAEFFSHPVVQSIVNFHQESALQLRKLIASRS
jgi:hypothetical protein